jgi:hypothetical protein
MLFKDSEKKEIRILEQIIFKIKNHEEGGYNYWNKLYNEKFILKVKMVSEEEYICWNSIELNRKEPPVSTEFYTTHIPAEFHIEMVIIESYFFPWIGDLIVKKVSTATNECVIPTHTQKYLLGFGEIFIDTGLIFRVLKKIHLYI